MSARCAVYIFGYPHATFGHVVKVGISNNVFSRLNAIQSHCPDVVVPHFNFDLPSRDMAYAIEQGFHRRFDASRIRGEWFGMREYQAIYLLSIAVVRALGARYSGEHLREERERSGLLKAFDLLDRQGGDNLHRWCQEWMETEEEPA